MTAPSRGPPVPIGRHFAAGVLQRGLDPAEHILETMADQPSTMPDDYGSGDPREQLSWLSLPPMRYPSLYCWLILASSMDIMLTWVILERGGIELNPVANLVIAMWKLPGAVLFKFSLMLFVIVVCEVAGRDRDRLGRRLAMIAIFVSSVPVAYSLMLLFWHHTG